MSPQQKILIITTDPTVLKWRSKRAKIKAITSIVNEMDKAELSIEVMYRDLVPAVFEGRITHEWFDSISAPEKKRGYEFVLIHMGDKQRKKWGIEPSLRGAAQKDYDAIGEAYFWADEKTLRNGFNQFIEVCCHEFRHLIKHALGGIDDTHELHDANGTLKGSFKGLDFAKYNPALRNQRAQTGYMVQAVNALVRLFRLAKRPTLYQAAASYLGRDASLSDIAPDELGCAESVSVVIRDILPDFPIIIGTWTLNERLRADKRFRAVTVPMPGTIIISPTGTGNSAKVPNGHVGIFATGDAIMSNDSNTGFWEENYTLKTWTARWGKAGYPVLMYQLIK